MFFEVLRNWVVNWLLNNLSCRQILTGLSLGSFSSQDLVEEYLRRIEDGKVFNAVAFLDPSAVRESALEADKRRATGDRSPLLGLPLSVKDSIAVKGWPWRSGSFAREDVIAQNDATTVARLREAGAIFLCKTTTPEYTWSVETESALHGITRNPYDLDRTSGGSSGGEAVLHAIGASPAGLGSDGLNSIRVPAHFCGTTGLRPSTGVVPETGVWPTTRETGLMDTSTIGPMAKFADDLDLLLDFIVGPDGLDPFTHPLGTVGRRPLKGLKVGYWRSHPVAPADLEIQNAVESAANRLDQAGSIVTEMIPFPIEDSVEIAFSIMAPDGGELVRKDVAAAKGRHSPSFAVLIEQLRNQELTMSQYLSAVSRWKAVRAAIRTQMSNFDIVLAPVAAHSAPKHLSSLAEGDVGLDVSAYTYSFAIALAGLPSVSLPIKITNTGLPVGIQIMSSPHSDRVAVGVAAALQEEMGLIRGPLDEERR